MNFDLNIGNYSKKELEEILELPTNYDENIIQMKETKLRHNIMGDVSIPSSIKAKTLGFITNVKNMLVLNINKKNTDSNVNFGTKMESLANSFNNISNAKVTAILPPNVKWTGYTSPTTEKINYDSNTGQIVWDVGEIKSGTGSNYPSKEVSFQVSITPSLSQVGQEMNLVNETTISGIDTFSGERIGEVKPPTTTNIFSDPQYERDIGKVVR
jgi:hypothetical protein